MSKMRLLMVPALLVCFTRGSQAFIKSSLIHPFLQSSDCRTFLSASDKERVEVSPETAAERPQTKQDDGRKHDMTDRFRYSVNAMMGTYDPLGVDDERQDGNILQAVLHFPANFTFSAVGKTNGEDLLRDLYVEEVKRAVLAISGDVESTFEVLPRGNKFTKVQCVVEVQSATMISSIFEDIANLERTVMRF